MMNRHILLVSGLFCGMLFFQAETKVSESFKKNVDTETMKGAHTTSVIPANQTVVAADHGRGHLHRRKKILKHLYPVLMAVLFAKLVVVPLILKVLIATTSSAFVMSKIALITSAVVALSWLLGVTRERAKLQIVQYPGGGKKRNYGGWNVNEKYTPHYSDWPYDGVDDGDGHDKNFFL